MTEFVELKDARQPVLLAVLAHPDDETFGTGGTLAMYARRGVKVYLVCATRGEVGAMDESLMRGFNSIAERRESELRCAAEKLGLAGVYFLDYRDSGMSGSEDNQHPQALFAALLDEVAGKVAHYFRLLKPQVVITFDPIGGYRHPDHIAIHNATVRAYDALADPSALPDPEGLPYYRPEKLYFQTISRTFLRFAVRLLRIVGRDPHKFGENGDIDLASLAEVNFPTHASINYRPVVAIRDEASACHASQGGGQMSRGFVATVRRYVFSSETYMRHPAPVNQPVETDLFAGL